MNIIRARLVKPGFAFLVVIVFCAAPALAQKLKPVRSFNVSFPQAKEGEPYSGAYGLTYVRKGQLAFWYTERVLGELSKRDELQEGDPWRMRIQLLDTTTSEDRQLDWPTRLLSSDLVLTPDGPIALTGPVVRCLDADLKESGQAQLDVSAAHRKLRWLAPSPGGHAVWSIDSGEKIVITRVDTSTCKAGWSVSQPQSLTSLSANDSVLVATSGAQLGIWTPTARWKLLYRAQECCLRGAQFVKQDAIMVYHEIPQGKRAVMLISTAGKVLMEDSIDKNYDPGPIVPSVDGKFAAVAVPKIDLLSRAFGAAPESNKFKVRLYDLARTTEVASLDTSSERGRFRIAISPDGSEVAVLSGSKVSIYGFQP